MVYYKFIDVVFSDAAVLLPGCVSPNLPINLNNEHTPFYNLDNTVSGKGIKCHDRRQIDWLGKAYVHYLGIHEGRLADAYPIGTMPALKVGERFGAISSPLTSPPGFI